MKSISGWNILLYYNTDKYRQLLHRGEFIISLFHANVFPIQSMKIVAKYVAVFLALIIFFELYCLLLANKAKAT